VGEITNFERKSRLYKNKEGKERGKAQINSGIKTKLGNLPKIWEGKWRL